MSRDPQRHLSNQYRYRVRVRTAVIRTLGGFCIKCGFSDPRALQIDHIEGEGQKERNQKLPATAYYKKVMESFLKGEEKYQLLCANCNWIKRDDRMEYAKSKTNPKVL